MNRTLALALLAVAATATACDTPIADAPKAITTDCAAEGAIWGPCRADQAPPGGCNPGLTCLTAGWQPNEIGICVPYGTYGAEVCTSPESQACAATIGTMVVVPEVGMCFVDCISDDDCGSGTVCSEGWPGLCLWPGTPGEDPPVMTTGLDTTTTSSGGISTTAAETTSGWWTTTTN
jgi:hypothetical protein